MSRWLRFRLRLKAAYYVLTGRGTVVFNAHIITEGITVMDKKDRRGRTIPRLILENRFDSGRVGIAFNLANWTAGPGIIATNVVTGYDVGISVKSTADVPWGRIAQDENDGG